MAPRADAAFQPYAFVMVGALPPFVGHVITFSVHHKKQRAIDLANRLCDAVYRLGCKPDWPYSFGVIDRRDGATVWMTDTTERILTHGEPNQRRRPAARNR